MVANSFMLRIRISVATALACGISIAARGLTILSGPSFTPATNAALAGLLQLTTDQDSRVSVSVSDGTNTWARGFYEYSTTHAVPLLGFKAARTNLITVSVYDKFRNAVTADPPLVFVTAPLPNDFPTSVLLTNEPDKMEPGYTVYRSHRISDLCAPGEARRGSHGQLCKRNVAAAILGGQNPNLRH